MTTVRLDTVPVDDALSDDLRAFGRECILAERRASLPIVASRERDAMKADVVPQQRCVDTLSRLEVRTRHLVDRPGIARLAAWAWFCRAERVRQQVAARLDGLAIQLHGPNPRDWEIRLMLCESAHDLRVAGSCLHLAVEIMREGDKHGS